MSENPNNMADFPTSFGEPTERRSIGKDPYDDLDYSKHDFVFQNTRPDKDPYQPVTTDAAFKNIAQFKQLQQECWNRAQNSPYISSAIADYKDRLTGYGFRVSSSEEQIRDYLDRFYDDYRNELSINFPKYVGREGVQGELYLQLTVHGASDPGFVEVDFIPPSALTGGDNGTGKVFHPDKPTMPLYYRLKRTVGNTASGVSVRNTKEEIVPSIYVAYDNELAEFVNNSAEVTEQSIEASRATTENVGSRYIRRFNRNLGGFRRFIVEWNDGLVTERNLSSLVTIITWANYYEDLKRYEMDHKKASGNYAWVFEPTDPRAAAKWEKLSKEQKAATGIARKKEPGSTIVLPYGFKASLQSPQLPKLSNEDVDIEKMISAGANISLNDMTGQFSGTTFSGVRESGKSQSDRNKGAIARFERFLRLRFFKAVLFLASNITPSRIPYTYRKERTIGFEGEEKTPITKMKRINAENLLNITFPYSAVDNFSDRVKAALGSKSGDLTSMLNIPRSEVASMIGIQNYDELMLRKADEDRTVPDPSGFVDPEELERLRNQAGQGDTESANNDSSDDSSNNDSAE